jgi:hypothetical protein
MQSRGGRDADPQPWASANAMQATEASMVSALGHG